MRWAIATLVLELAGCDQVLGLNQLKPLPAGPSVTGQLTQVITTNDSNFQPVTSQRTIPRDELAATATLDDGTEVDAIYNDDGSFSFPLESQGQGYRFKITLYGQTSELQASVPRLELFNRVAGRLMPAAIGSTSIMFPYDASSPTISSAQIVTTGQYSQTDTHQFGTVTFPWSGALGSGNLPLGLLDASAYDYIYLFELTESMVSSMPYWLIGKAYGASISQQSGIVATLPGPSPVQPNACVHFATHGADEFTRVSGALPGTFNSYENWQLYWMPDPDSIGGVGASYLAYGGGAAAQNLDLSPQLYMPMSGGQLVVSAFAGEQIAVTASGATSSYVYTGTQRYAKVSAQAVDSCGAAAADLTGTIGLLGMPALDGTPLDESNQTIAITGADAMVTWNQVASGTVDFTTVAVFEVVSVPGMTSAETAFTPRQSVTTLDSSARLDPTQLVSGNTYMIAVSSHLANPNAPSGDFSELTFPFENATTYSLPFVVQ